MTIELFRHFCMAEGDGGSGGGGSPSNSAPVPSVAASAPSVIADVSSAGNGDATPLNGNLEASSAPAESADPLSVIAGIEGDKSDTPPVDFSAMSDEDYAKEITFQGDFDEGVSKQMVVAFKEIGISPEQANKLAEKFSTATKEAQNADKAFYEKTVSSLREQTFKEMSKEDLTYARRAVDKILSQDPALHHTVLTTMLGSHPAFLKMAAMAGKNMMSDGLPGGIAGAGGRTMSDAEKLYHNRG